MRYVISDIHGDFDKFKQMLEKIQFGKDDILYILGDMVDRGDEPIALIQYIMRQPNMKVLLGNHEDMMLKVLEHTEDEKAYNHWVRNGGEVTYKQYNALEQSVQRELEAYLRSLPLYIELEDYLLVHAGVCVERENQRWEDVRDHQIKRDLIWMRYDFINEPTIVDKKVIFGHTQTFYFAQAGEIWFGEDKIGIDCGVYSKEEGGRLGCLNVDTLETYYVE